MRPKRSEQPRAKNNYILLVFDSCRYDTFAAARPKTIRKLGKVERRWSYASWTSPSHYNLLIGLMPHRSPRHVFASEYYQRDLLKFKERLGAPSLEFKSFVPRLYLPVLLQSLGYRTHAMVSLPVLNPATILNTGFDSYRLMERHNDYRICQWNVWDPLPAIAPMLPNPRPVEAAPRGGADGPEEGKPDTDR